MFVWLSLAMDVNSIPDAKVSKAVIDYVQPIHSIFTLKWNTSIFIEKDANTQASLAEAR